MAALRRRLHADGVAAAGTALSAYLLGKMTNEAYVDRNFHGIVIVAVVAMAIFAIKGMASYGARDALGDRQSHRRR